MWLGQYGARSFIGLMKLRLLQCCSFRFLESSAKVGLSIDQLDDSCLAGGAATGIVAMHLHAERGGMMA